MFRRMIVLVFLAVMAGCADAPRWSEATVEANAETVAEAKEAAQAMFRQLLARLQDAVQEGGLAGAIEVCRAEAPAIARAISVERGLQIGRTSHKLRNRSNTPPAWVAHLESKTPRVYAHPDGRTGVTLPIVAIDLCMKCHGADDLIQDEVKEALALSYPEDEATGFAAGDLRGQFWVEIPAER